MASPEHDVVLVRHGELGLKSPRVRARLERTLTTRIEEALALAGVEAIVARIHSRHLVEGNDLAAVMAALARVFGVTTISPAARSVAELAALADAAARYAVRHWPEGAETFAIRARRVGTHPFTSRDVAVAAGNAVRAARAAIDAPARVDLDAPEFTIEIEVRNKEAFFLHERFPGPGGLPLGTQGRVAVWVAGMDAAAAAYLMMRRGAQVVPYVLVPAGHEGPHPGDHVAAVLAQWGGPRRVQRVPGPAGEPGPAASPEAHVAFARAAIEAGIQLARARGAHAVVTAETARVPWAARLPETHPGGDVPVLRPLMGLDRGLVDDFRELVGLPRRGAARTTATERAYTAGGRVLGSAITAAAPAAAAATETTTEDAWDPW